MSFKPNSFVLFTVLALVAFNAHAELFKWVDEDGNVHYSDKQPGDAVDTRLLPGDTKPSALPQSAGVKPIIRPYEKTARRLHLLEMRYVWKRESEVNQTSKLGVYHTGKGCTTRGAIKTPDVFIHHQSLLPSEARLTSRVHRIINGLDYEAERTEKYRLLERLQKTGGLSLHAEIIDLEFNTCAPNIRKSERLGPVTKIAAHRFTKHRVKLKVNWQLKTNRDQELVYEAVTSGSYNGWNQSTTANEVIADALESAVLALFSRQEFIARILVEEDIPDPGQTKFVSLKPIDSDAQTRTRKLFVAVDGRSWINDAENSTPIGNLLFGDRCAAKKPLPLGDALNQHRWLVADDRPAGQAIAQRIRPLGYEVNPASADMLGKLEESGGYSLNARLVRVTYDACAPALSASTKYKPIDRSMFRRLVRNRVQVWVEWTLMTDRNRKLLYRTSTVGFAGSLVADTRGAEAMKDAIGMAAEQLFADPDFIELIKLQTDAIPVDQTFDASPADEVRGIVMPPGREAVQLFIVSESNPWQPLATNQNIGLYAFGAECSPFRERSWPVALNEHPRLFPDPAELANATAKVAKSLGYRFQLTNAYSVVNLKRKLGGYSLHARISELRFDSCAPDLDEDIVYSKRKLSSSQFKRHRAIVRIDWRLLGDGDQDLRFEATTEGVADSWLLNSKGSKVLGLAVEDASKKLFARKAFIAHLVKPSEQEKSLFSGLLSFFEADQAEPDEGDGAGAPGFTGKFLLQAHAAQVFSEINVLKVGMLEHYMMNGEWPDSLNAIGYSNASFANSDSIDYVNLQPDGSIIVELKEKFGKDRVIVLRPALEDGGVHMNRWDCSSNLDSAYLPRNCEIM